MITFSSLGNYGQLGNQMFEFAALLNIASYNDYDFGIPYKNETPTYWVNDPKNPRKYGLELHHCFNITAKDSSNYTDIKTQYSQLDFNYNPEILNISDNTNILGYFQSEKYFKESIPQVLEEFTFKTNVLSDSLATLKELKSNYDKEFVSIHVRRGDYLSYPDHHPILDYNYYNQAMNKFTDVHFLVFSDDIEYCKSMFNEIENVSYINNDTFSDLCLMSLCEHQIIANSSFSWWGAYLNKNINKCVIAPNQWFGKGHNNLDIRDLIPERWIKL